MLFVQPGYGWATPSIASIELMQCIIRAIPTDEKKKYPVPYKSSDGPIGILQFPHITFDMVNILIKRSVTSITDLERMDDSQLRSELSNLNLTGKQIEEVQTAVHAFPRLSMVADCLIEDEVCVDCDVVFRCS